MMASAAGAGLASACCNAEVLEFRLEGGGWRECARCGQVVE